MDTMLAAFHRLFKVGWLAAYLEFDTFTVIARYPVVCE